MTKIEQFIADTRNDNPGCELWVSGNDWLKIGKFPPVMCPLGYAGMIVDGVNVMLKVDGDFLDNGDPEWRPMEPARA